MAAVAKINAPQLRDAYARERLYALLDAARPPAALWICAPPGAGKTTLAASWIAARSLEPLWYRVDEGDADPATLFYYLGLAAAQAAPRRRRPMPLFSADYALGLQAFSRNYFRQLYERLPARSVLVFDNFQDAGADVPLHAIVQLAIDELPAGTCLVIVSRSAPPPALTRLVAHGALRVVGPEAMQLSREEVAGIAARQRRAPPDPAALDRLAEQAQGWAAGLVLLCAAGGSSGMAPQQASSLQAVFDYFAGEILRKVDGETQDMLMTTALLPMTSADMAVRLTGQPGAALVLEKLYAYNYFTLRDEQAEPVYHYHPLFRRFLLTQAENKYGKEQLDGLRRRAAALLEDQGQPEAAFELWRAAGDWDAAATVLCRIAAAMMFTHGRRATVAGWIEAFPAARLHGNPWLLWVHGHARLLTAADESVADFERAFLLSVDRDDRDLAYRALTGALVSITLDHAGDTARFDRWLDRFDMLVARYPRIDDPLIEAEALCWACCALWYRGHNDPRAVPWIERAARLASSAGDVRLLMAAHHFAVMHGLLRGEYARAGRAIEVYTSQWRHMRDPSALSVVHQLLVYYYRIIGDYDAAERSMHEGLAFIDETGASTWRYQVLMNGVHIMLDLDRLDEAESLLSRVRECVSVDVGLAGVHYHWLRTGLHLARGDLQRARVDAERTVALQSAAGLALFAPLAPLLLAEVQHAQGETAAAQGELARALAAARSTGSRNCEQWCRLLEARFAFAEGRDADGRVALAAGLALGRDEHYANYCPLLRGATPQLCARALDAGIEPDYVRFIIRKRKLPAPSSEIEAWPWPLKVFTLGSFRLLKDDQPIEFGRKAPKKLVALLKAVVALGGRDVGETRLADALWPDLDADAAREALKTALHRLDKLLGDGIVVNQGGCVALDAQRVWVDAWALERRLAQAEALDTPPAERRAASDLALALYRGAFLPADESEPWALSMRERLRMRFIRHLTRLGRDHAAAGEHDAAAACYLRGLEVDDLAEELYRSAMHSYAQAGRRVEALAVYRRLRKVLSLSLGIAPSDATDKLYRSLLG